MWHCNIEWYLDFFRQATVVPLAHVAPGKGDLKNLKSIIKDGQQEFYHAVPQPAALTSIYMGQIPQGQTHPGQYSSPRFSLDPSVDNGNVPDMLLNNVPFRCLTSVLALTTAPDHWVTHTPFRYWHIAQHIRLRSSQRLQFQLAPCPAWFRGHLSNHNSGTSSWHQHGHYRFVWHRTTCGHHLAQQGNDSLWHHLLQKSPSWMRAANGSYSRY